MPDSAVPARLGSVGRDNYSLGRVPGEVRDSWRITAVQRFAQLSTPSQFLIGATLGTRMSLGLAVLAIVLGLVILEAVIIVTGVMGAREGSSTSLLARWTGFGRDGSALAGLVIAVTSAGWFGVQDSFFAQSLAGTLGGPPLRAWSLLGGALVIILVLRGFALMRRVPFVTVPGFLLLVAYTVYRALLGHLISHPAASASLHPPAQPRRWCHGGRRRLHRGCGPRAGYDPVEPQRRGRRQADRAAGVTTGESVCLTGCC
jgi:cytosine permease